MTEQQQRCPVIVANDYGEERECGAENYEIDPEDGYPRCVRHFGYAI